MNESLTEMAFVLDRSGSMGGHESDTIGGFNSLLSRQKEAPGQAIVSTVMFDHQIEWLHDRTDIRRIGPITSHDYWVRGSTALLDAIGETIRRIDLAQHYAREEDVPAHTMVVVTTDGLENASRRFGSQEVKNLIHAHEERGWEFIFLGANIDAVETGREIGFRADRSADFVLDSTGSGAAFDGVCKAASAVRAGAALGSDWRDGIDRDFDRRSGRGRS